jgi:hypothetical protein
LQNGAWSTASRWRRSTTASSTSCTTRSTRSTWRWACSTHPGALPSYRWLICVVVKRWYGQRRGQCLLTLSTAPTVSPAPDDSSHVWRRRPTGASTSHTRQQLPGSSCPSPARLLKHNCATLAPGRRARSREGHDEERTEAHDTGAIDCKKEELEVPMGTVRLVPSSSTFRAPIWTRARTPRCDLRSSTLATPSPIM